MSDSDEEFLMLESAITKHVLTSTRIRSCSTHAINAKRREFGEYHHLYEDLRRDGERFYEYMRMSVKTFDYICRKIESKLDKKWSNCHSQPILTEERVMLTLRLVLSQLFV